MVHTVKINIDWKLLNQISSIDRFDSEWKGTKRRESSTLTHLKSMATVQSVGASTRIEGSQLNDEQIDELIKNLDTTKLEERDQQEVVGYFNLLDNILNSYDSFRITENEIKGMQNEMLRHVEKDAWHRGGYKQFENSVEATDALGNKTIIFQTTPPGVETEDAMRSLIEWYGQESVVHALVKIAIFVYDFVSIHPFQDGNGRMSRLLSTLLLLQHGYSWIEYVSFEHEIEARKKEYYASLRSCQANRPGENVNIWVDFFLSCLTSLTEKLEEKIKKRTSQDIILGNRLKHIYDYIETNPGTSPRQILENTEVRSIWTVKKDLSKLVDMGKIQMNGVGRGINYTVI